MHVVITGANRGIGLALTQIYLTQGHQVTALCRRASDALKTSGATIVEGVDVSDADTLTLMTNALKGKQIDILINNAGLLADDNLDQLHWPDIEAQFAVNALGPLRVTHALLSQLKAGSIIALITSRMGSVADNSSGAYYGYRMSKAALNIAGKSLAVDLALKGIAVAILHPGFVQTDMVGHAGDISAVDAAQRLVARITETSLVDSGQFRHANGDPLPW
ncbi:SDR family oxidoreductase [Simiduia curdlanivorans]|uniref:SDR family oxidoreductase n=1 Tax=Simiduia curdlanivorans TaxID=1492769 RepID=A0ABV8V1I0_9GAMM|nr:SDR family oxidoreductase [Simiduia curdlanivorans]MDN3640468.1 SDR family oxidoreductase [Simiduia curdlanivorans]